MRAVKILGERQLVVQDWPDPVPEGNEVVVKIHAASICGSDLHALYRTKEEIPFIPGHEGAGEVVAVDQSTMVRVGDRVMTLAFHTCGVCEWCRQGELSLCRNMKDVLGFGRNGVHAEFVLIPDRCLLPLPDQVSYEAGATLLDPIGTPFHALKRMKANAGHTIVVFGLGPMGLGSVALASFLGARVIGVDPIPFRRDHALRIGASLVLDPGEVDVLQALQEATQGIGPEMALECSGTAQALGQALDAVRQHGAVSIIGENPEALIKPSGHFNRKEITLCGSTCFPLGDYEGILRFIERGLDPTVIITHRFGIEDAAEAYSLFDQGATGKVLLTPHGSS